MKIFLLDDYHRMTKPKYSIILTKVCKGVYGHTAEFVAPPILEADFFALVNNYRDINNEFEAGAADYKAALDTAITKLNNGMDTLKDYVEELPNLTVELANLSGFTLNKQSLSDSLIPDKPVYIRLVHLGAGSTRFYYASVDNAEYYGAFLVEGKGLPEGSFFANGILELPDGTKPRMFWHTLKQRVKTFYGLTIGKEYTLYYFAGNTAGVSGLSDGLTFSASNN